MKLRVSHWILQCVASTDRQKIGARSKWMPVINELSNIAVNVFDVKKSASSNLMVIVTKVVVTGTYRILFEFTVKA